MNSWRLRSSPKWSSTFRPSYHSKSSGSSRLRRWQYDQILRRARYSGAGFSQSLANRHPGNGFSGRTNARERASANASAGSRYASTKSNSPLAGGSERRPYPERNPRSRAPGPAFVAFQREILLEMAPPVSRRTLRILSPGLSEGLPRIEVGPENSSASLGFSSGVLVPTKMHRRR